jgi:hypothetical protein
MTWTHLDPLVSQKRYGSKDPNTYQNVSDPEHCFADSDVKINNSDRRFKVSSQKKGKALKSSEHEAGTGRGTITVVLFVSKAQKMQKKENKQTKIVYHIVAEDLLVWRTF